MKLVLFSILLICFGAILGHDVMFGYHETHDTEFAHHLFHNSHDHENDCQEGDCSIDLTVHIFLVPVSTKTNVDVQTVILEFYKDERSLKTNQDNPLVLVDFERTDPELPLPPWIRSQRLRGPPMS